ncbi:MAG: hypothetical protein SOX38_06475, partial [Candidatus Limiplasma sp.]|nr:hypothetical protein [Candidatus Limiplasma sp.]
FLFKPSIRPPAAKERRSKARGLSKRRPIPSQPMSGKGKKERKKAPKLGRFEAGREGEKTEK